MVVSGGGAALAPMTSTPATMSAISKRERTRGRVREGENGEIARNNESGGGAEGDPRRHAG
jgi:hypothetical protein